MESTPLYEWETMEYELNKKSTDWYWAIGVIAVCGTVASIIYGNFLFAVFIIIGAGSLILFQVKKPKVIKIAILSQGIKIDQYLYTFDSLKNFWIESDAHRLLLTSTRFILPTIILNLEGADQDEVRELLSEKLEEKEIKHSLMAQVVDKLGM
jgi:type IV secretory pathway component VirB8